MIASTLTDPLFYRRLADFPRYVFWGAKAQAPAPNAHADSAAEFPIDLVYTWVDGSDPAHLAARTHWAELEGQQNDNLNPLRFVEHGELRLSLRSVEAFLPWVRQIFIITSHQLPSWLDTNHPKIRIVDAQSLFPRPECYPSFNSHAVEFQLHRIPDLSEHFIYCCDDMFFGAACAPADFFTAQADGARPLLSLDHYNLPAFVSVLLSRKQEYIWRRAWNNLKYLIEHDFPGYRANLHSRHQATPLRKSLMEEVSTRYSALYHSISATRFRSPQDIPPIGFVCHYALASARAVLRDIPQRCCDLRQMIRHIRAGERPKLLCLSQCNEDTQAWQAMAEAGFCAQSSAFEKSSGAHAKAIVK